MGVHQKSETERIGKASDRRIIDRKRCPSDKLSRVDVSFDSQRYAWKGGRIGNRRLNRCRLDGYSERQRFGRSGGLLGNFYDIAVRRVRLVVKSAAVSDTCQNTDAIGESFDGFTSVFGIPFEQFERPAAVSDKKQRSVLIKLRVIKHSAVFRRQEFDSLRLPIEHGNGLDSRTVVRKRNQAVVRRNGRMKDVDFTAVEERLNDSRFEINRHKTRIRSVRLNGGSCIFVDVRRLEKPSVFCNPPRFSAFGTPFKQVGDRMRMTFDGVVNFIARIKNTAAVKKSVVIVCVGQGGKRNRLFGSRIGIQKNEAGRIFVRSVLIGENALDSRYGAAVIDADAF